MSDAQLLKDAIEEYRKANKKLDEGLKKAEQNNRHSRREAEEQSRRPS